MVNRPGRPKPKKSKGGFSNYKAPSYESMKKIASQKGGRYDSIFLPNFDSWRAKEGNNQVRILPPTWDGFEHYAYEVWVHKNVGTDPSTYLCLNKNKDPRTGKPMQKRCPVCEAVKKMKADGDDGAKEINATTQYISWIIDRDAKKSFPPVLWAMSWTQNRDIAMLATNDRTGKTLPIAHAEEGYDILIKRVGTKLNTKYVLAIDRDESPATDDDDEFAEIEEFCVDNPVPSTLKFYDAEYLENALSGSNEEEDEDLDEKPRRKNKSRDEEEDEADDDTSDDDSDTKSRRRRSRDEEEEDEDDKPRRGGIARRTLKKNKDEDEEEEETDDDGEDEEDEEKPRSKSRRSRDDDEEDEEKPARRRRKPADDDEEDKESDEDEEADEEEEEEEEKPRRRGRPSKKDEEDDEEPPRRRGTARRRK